MAAKSPTTSVRSREIIGVDQFSQRREVFDKHDTVFLPLPSPTTPTYKEVEPIITSNHGKTTSNFKRNTPAYSSMRESRTEDRNIEFRTRKYSDNFTSELNQSDDVDYRHSMTERTRRISKLRSDFLNKMNESSADSRFARTSTSALMQANSGYKVKSPNLYKFAFAEPYATPPPVRRVVVDLGPSEINGEKENQDPEAKPKDHSVPNNDTSPKIHHQKLYEELVKRYSPQRVPVDWTLPPTRPRVIGSIPKSTSSLADSINSTDKKTYEENLKKSEDDDVFVKKGETNDPIEDLNGKAEEELKEMEPKTEIKLNGPETVNETVIKNEEVKKEMVSKTSLAELDEKNDEVPELSMLQRLGKEPAKKPSQDQFSDMTIPALLEKMTEEAEELENQKKEPKKIKRKRSFLDKLLRRKKDK